MINKVFKGLLAVLLLVAVFLAVDAPAWAQGQMDYETQELVELASARYGPAKGFRAAYSLEAATVSLAGQGGLNKMKSSGTIIFARPDNLRLIQVLPHEEEIVYSKEGYWWYSSQTKEAHRFPAGEMAGVISPFVHFFSGLDKMGQWFEAKRMPGLDEGDNKLLRLTPHSVKMGLNRLDALIAPDGGIVQVTIHSLIGDVYRYRFSDLEMLTEMPVEGFSFSPPVGALIIQH